MKIVIGGAYGDEGKGKVVDEYAASVSNPMVVRSHSSGQCSHTVVVGDKRHVFGHVGSGTFAGAPTYFGRKFYHNLLVLVKEVDILQRKEIFPVLYSDRLAEVILPHDILLNRVLEETRSEKHGSCGIGYGVGVERSKSYGLGVRISDLNSLSIADLMKIGDEWANNYLDQHKHAKEAYHSSTHKKSFEKLLEIMLESAQHIKIVDFDDIKKDHNIIFEGAQGLLLDERYGTMPYVTWGDCGVLSPLNFTGLESRDLEVNYVLRSYLTRHGNGPMLNDLVAKDILETTNTANKYQGTFRFGTFDLRMLDAIKLDSELTKPFHPKLVLTVTWMDIWGEVPVILNGDTIWFTPKEKFKELLSKELPEFEIQFKYSPNREV